MRAQHGKGVCPEAAYLDDDVGGVEVSALKAALQDVPHAIGVPLLRVQRRAAVVWRPARKPGRMDQATMPGRAGDSFIVLAGNLLDLTAYITRAVNDCGFVWQSNACVAGSNVSFVQVS